MLIDAQKKKVKTYFRNIYPKGYCETGIMPEFIFDPFVVKEIITSENPSEAFDEKIYNAIDQSEKDENDELYFEISDFYNKNLDDFEGDLQGLTEYVRETIGIDASKLFQDCRAYSVNMDIYIDTGDGKYDYTSNALYPHYNGRKEYTYEDVMGFDELKDASLFWLAEMQGYSKKELYDYLLSHTDEETCDKKEFLPSVFQELINMPAPMPQLVFLRKMPMTMVLDILEGRKKHDGKTKILMPNDTVCSLYDKWNGGGSLFGIELEKDLYIPAEYIDLRPAGTYDISIEDAYEFPDEVYQSRKGLR